MDAVVNGAPAKAPANTALVRGIHLDWHVITSCPTGDAGERMQFETTRSPLGEGFAKEARVKRNRSMFKYYSELLAALLMDEVFLEEDCRIDPIFPGDEVFLYGRPVTHDGQQRNRPVVRFGNISMLPDSDSPFKVGEREQLAFLVECRSLSGFSGSPAFVHLAQPRLTDQRLDSEWPSVSWSRLCSCVHVRCC